MGYKSAFWSSLNQLTRMATRARFELATLRLTAEEGEQILPEFALIEGNQQVVRKRSESFSPSLFIFCSQFAAICRDSYVIFMTARTWTRGAAATIVEGHRSGCYTLDDVAC